MAPRKTRKPPKNMRRGGQAGTASNGAGGGETGGTRQRFSAPLQSTSGASATISAAAQAELNANIELQRAQNVVDRARRANRPVTAEQSNALRTAQDKAEAAFRNTNNAFGSDIRGVAGIRREIRERVNSLRESLNR
jgi:hypothetical protein